MRVPFTNTTDHPVYVGGIKVNAGETRTVNAADLPSAGESQRPAVATPAPPDPLVSLVAKNMPDIIAALPTLKRAEVERLISLEADGKDRKGVAEACGLRLLEIEDQEKLAAEEAERLAKEEAERKEAGNPAG
jgi:hypothetical protein